VDSDHLVEQFEVHARGAKVLACVKARLSLNRGLLAATSRGVVFFAQDFGSELLIQDLPGAERMVPQVEESLFGHRIKLDTDQGWKTFDVEATPDQLSALKRAWHDVPGASAEAGPAEVAAPVDEWKRPSSFDQRTGWDQGPDSSAPQRAKPEAFAEPNRAASGWDAPSDRPSWGDEPALTVEPAPAAPGPRAPSPPAVAPDGLEINVTPVPVYTRPGPPAREGPRRHGRSPDETIQLAAAPGGATGRRVLRARAVGREARGRRTEKIARPTVNHALTPELRRLAQRMSQSWSSETTGGCIGALVMLGLGMKLFGCAGFLVAAFGGLMVFGTAANAGNEKIFREQLQPELERLRRQHDLAPKAMAELCDRALTPANAFAKLARKHYGSARSS
jgi:hypothetical protein